VLLPPLELREVTVTLNWVPDWIVVKVVSLSPRLRSRTIRSLRHGNCPLVSPSRWMFDRRESERGESKSQQLLKVINLD
jgi:hypothetical protein